MQRRYFLQGFASAAASCVCGFSHALATEAPRWGYDGETGPDRWGKLDAGFRACSFGKRQSPIDITQVESASFPDLHIAFPSLTGELVNNGYTIQIQPDTGGRISLWDNEYELLQAHFHSPSEHQVSGTRFPMEAHFVHRYAGTGMLAVLGVFMLGGGNHALFSSIMNAAPSTKGGRIAIPADAGSLADFLPQSRSYWAYNGSLTTPPCDEIVNWVVFRSPIHVNEADIAKFKALYPSNSRPVQDLFDRSVHAAD